MTKYSNWCWAACCESVLRELLEEIYLKVKLLAI